MRALRRYKLPRVILARLVEMRHAEGFALTEAHARARAHDKSARYSWSLTWQADVLLRYELEFVPGDNGMGQAACTLDVTCNADFTARLTRKV